MRRTGFVALNTIALAALAFVVCDCADLKAQNSPLDEEASTPQHGGAGGSTGASGAGGASGASGAPANGASDLSGHFGDQDLSWSPIQWDTNSNGGLHIFAGSLSEKSGDVVIEGPFVTGTVPCENAAGGAGGGSSGVTIVRGVEINPSGATSFVSWVPGASCTITITSIGVKGGAPFSGTFSATLVDIMDPTNTLAISNGKFTTPF